MTMTPTVLPAVLIAAALAAALPARADVNAGAYLAARHASYSNDFVAASEYYSAAVVRDPGNLALIEAALTAELSRGEIDRAVALARRLREADAGNQISNLAIYGVQAAAGAWDDVLAGLDAEKGVGPLYDGLLRAWALVGQGRMSDALTAFDAVVETRGTEAFGLYHKALALAAVGDFETAAEVLSGENGRRIGVTRRGIVAQVQILSQLDRHGEAIEILADSFGSDAPPFAADLVRRLEAGEAIPFDIVRSPADGAAELHYTIATAISGEAADGYTLLYARLAEYLRPGHIDGLLLTAGVLERLGRYRLATDVYDRVPRDSAYFHAAELGRAQALRDSGRDDAAIEVLTQLGKSHGDLAVVHVTLGDFLRSLERYGEASEAYDRAIALIDTPAPEHWSLYFSRGITHEREDRWAEAEADFRKALELEPGQPQVLNYLGYSFVEMGRNMDEALAMIERAVDEQPNSGYITDSLGWVLYKLGRYDEAIGPMERAGELLPVDPIINDHLGDVLWAVGRKREAEFQWQRALSFDPDPEAAARIRRKLEVGLDKVLTEEGAPPLKVANGGN